MRAASSGTRPPGCGLARFAAGTQHVPVAELMLLPLTELALAPIRAWLAIDGIPSGHTLAGGAIIVGKIMCQALSDTRRRRTPLPMV